MSPVLWNMTSPRSKRTRVAATIALAGAAIAGEGRAQESLGASPPGDAAANTPPTVHPWPHAPGADPLASRFPVPRGFVRVAVEAGSFGDFLRSLPLREPYSAVLDYRGRVRHAADSPGVAAVVDIDVGQSDLQQCADFVFRMDAEWRYGRGDHSLAYRAASGTRLSYSRFLSGERAAASGSRLALGLTARPLPDDHRSFRAYLDEVFAWANTASLERDSAPVALAQVTPGDFFVVSGRPTGHAVLVLDAARDASGRTAVLLGEGYMPAQSFHVLNGSAQSWFVLEPNASQVTTPFWAPFPIGSLRRLP
jgi:hypothetical protein